jgi:hypothetical protein
MLVTIKPCGGGVVKDIPTNELAANQWSDALNVRFSNGVAQRRQGIRSAWNTLAVIPQALGLYVESSNGTRFLVKVGLAKVYADDGLTQTEITRYTDGKAISSITHVTTTATVTTATAHGRTTGDLIDLFGAAPSAYNVTAKAITVTGPTTFTYTMASDPGANATTLGQYSYNVTADFTGTADDRWTLDVFNGILILNNPVDGPYYWNGDITTRMRRLPGWAAGEKAYAMRSFKNYLIALAPTLSGTFKPHSIMWSESSEAGSIPTTWTATSTNDAGDSPQAAEAGGFLIDGEGLGDEFIVYASDARFALSYVGGEQVFALRRLPSGDGLLSRRCVVQTPKGHVFMSNGDIRLHQGQESVSIAEGLVRQWLFTSIDGTYSARSFLVLNPPKCEVWVVFPTYGETVPNKVAAWNWNDATWAIFDIPAATCAAIGLITAGVDSESWAEDTDPWASDTTRWYSYEYSPDEQRLVLGLNSMATGLADTGVTDLGSSVSWLLEKTGTTLDDDDSMKVISRVRPQLQANTGFAMSVSVTTTLHSSDTPVYGTAADFVAGSTLWANRFSPAGRFLAIKMEGSDDSVFALRSYDVEFAKRGRF